MEKKMRSITYNKLDNLYKKSKGYISTQTLLEEGFTNRQIALLIDENYLEKVCHGYYWLLRSGYHKPNDYKCIEVCLSNPRAVISMESACYYQGVGKTEPEILTVATERTDRSTMKMNFPIKRHYFSGNYFNIGIKRVQREVGSYRIYAKERSICDIIRLDTEDSDNPLVVEVLDSIKQKEEQYKRMLKYAELFKLKSLP